MSDAGGERITRASDLTEGGAGHSVGWFLGGCSCDSSSLETVWEGWWGKGAKVPGVPSEDGLSGDWTAGLEQVRAGKTAPGIPSVPLELEAGPS